jgi:5-methylcytosine-specific restriction endonuclease McrA
VSKGTHAPTVRFAPDCLDCEQKRRNEKKNEDRPYAILRRRAADHAHKAGVGVEFMWINMNYRAKVPVFRAMMTPEGLCTSCGHPFDNERDIQIEHRAPKRHRQDWARLHARNLDIACTNCNGRKSNKSYEQWLDDEEEARISNEIDRHNDTQQQQPALIQPGLWDDP